MSGQLPKGLPPPAAGKSGWPWTDGLRPASIEIQISHAEAAAASWPKITIVTPSYNQGQYLEATIRSVLLQGYPNLEYFVVDGGSTDDSVDIIKKYENHLAWWVSEKDSGQSHALNKAFARATGSIYAYINSDDFYRPGALNAMAKAFADGQEWVVGSVEYLLNDRQNGFVPQKPGKGYMDWFITCPISQPGSFWSARLHREAGPFRDDLHYFFDYEFWLRLRLNKNIFPAQLEKSVAMYRLHPDSKTMTDKGAFALERNAIIQEYTRYLSGSQRAALWLVQRHRRARKFGSRAISNTRQGNYRAAAKLVGRALWQSPFLALDPGIFHVVKQLLKKKWPESTVPDVWHDWDD